MKTISGKRLCKILSDKGWTRLRIKGSHHAYESLDGETHVSVPVHGNGDLQRGMLHRLMKDAGLTEADL